MTFGGNDPLRGALTWNSSPWTPETGLRWAGCCGTETGGASGEGGAAGRLPQMVGFMGTTPRPLLGAEAVPGVFWCPSVSVQTTVHHVNPASVFGHPHITTKCSAWQTKHEEVVCCGEENGMDTVGHV